jgi:predicted metal-dependent phosphoesterase TrpH
MDTAAAVEFDLHVHTTASDGTLTVDELPAAARQAGVGTVAVTDHDRVHPELDAPVTTRDGVRVVRGIELRVDAGDMRVDLLGYGVDPGRDLADELDRLQRNRVERARTIVDCIEAETGVELDIEPAEGVGRPHIARAVAASAAPYDYGGAFEHLIGNDCECYVARELPTFERGAGLLRESCAVVSLAHPFRYPDVDRALDLARDLDAVERYYAYGRPVDDARVEAVATDAGLLRTGGSDAHDRTLGRAGLAGDEARAFRERLESGRT